MSKTMKTNGDTVHKAGVAPTNRVAGKTAGMSTNGHDKKDGSREGADANPAPANIPEGKIGKVFLSLGAAVIAVAAAEYALRRFTKTGGILPQLRRLEKISSAYLASVEKGS